MWENKTNSLWGNKVGGFQLSWVFIIAWRRKEVRTGSRGCELRCWAISLPTVQGEVDNGCSSGGCGLFGNGLSWTWKVAWRKPPFPHLSFSHSWSLVYGLSWAASPGALTLGVSILLEGKLLFSSEGLLNLASWGGRVCGGVGGTANIFDLWNHTSAEGSAGLGFLSQGSSLLLPFIFLLPQVCTHSICHLCVVLEQLVGGGLLFILSLSMTLTTAACRQREWGGSQLLFIQILWSLV